jgi:hypothetical protein
LNNTEKRDEGVTVSQILIHLDMPESEVNKQVGMFMVTMQLKSANGETLFTSSRPVRGVFLYLLICLVYVEV